MGHHDSPRQPPLTDAVLDQISQTVGAHERTILRRLLGLPVRGRVSQRIDAELARRGLVMTAINHAA